MDTYTRRQGKKCVRILFKLYRKLFFVLCEMCCDFPCKKTIVAAAAVVPLREWFHANIQSNGMEWNGMECVSTCSHVNRLNHSFRIIRYYFLLFCFEFFRFFSPFFNWMQINNEEKLFFRILLCMSYLFFVISVFALFVYSVWFERIEHFDSNYWNILLSLTHCQNDQ